MHSFPIGRHGLIRRQSALDLGITDDQLAKSVRRGELIRLIPGVYAPADPAFADPVGRQRLHRLRCIAVATSELVDDAPHPLSHSAAAVMHGLELLKPSLQRVHVTTGESGHGSIRRHRHVHGAPLTDDEVMVIEGISVTSLERTAVDVAASGTFAQALTAFDQALRLDADRDVMAAMLEMSRRRGVRTARRALSFADHRSESVGESWSRAQMIEAGLPLPRLQHRFVCEGAVYFSDFDWDELLVGEFDGMVKYHRHVRPGDKLEDVVVREKIREDAIRGRGSMMLRWTWDVLEAGTLVRRLEPHLARLGLIA